MKNLFQSEVFWGADLPVDEFMVRRADDPACCFCRAEFAGMTFTVWLKLPLVTRITHRPPQDWRSVRARASA